MQHPDEGVIHTWLDGELPAEEAAALEAHIAECADCAAAVAEARGLIAASSRIVSALDIVPGDVIPAAAPRKRAWYANTQLRAAAAVLIVAGASLVVMRRERAPEMERIMDQAASASADSSSAAAAPSAVEADSARPLMRAMSETPKRDTRESLASPPAEQRAQNQAVPQNRVAAVPLKSGTARQAEAQRMQKVGTRALSAVPAEPSVSPTDAARPTNEVEEKALAGKAAGARVSAPPSAPVAAAAPPADLQQRNLSRLRDSTIRLDEVVVTGVATSSAKANDVSREAKLRELKSDTTGNVISITYAVSANVQVTLIEVAPQSFAPQRAESDEMKKEKGASGTSNVTVVPMTPRPVVKLESITWTNPLNGHVYTLSGPLSKEQLTALRKRLPAAKQ